MTETNGHTANRLGKAREECCERCRFFDYPDETSETGECRRHAPHLVLGQIKNEANVDDIDCSYDGVWPQVNPDCWCGEFQPFPPSAISQKPLNWLLTRISTRAWLVLLRLSKQGRRPLNKMGDFCQWSADELTEEKNFGPSCLSDLR